LFSVLSLAAFSIVTRATAPSLRASTRTPTEALAVMVYLFGSGGAESRRAFPVDTPLRRHHNTGPQEFCPDGRTLAICLRFHEVRRRAGECPERQRGR